VRQRLAGAGDQTIMAEQQAEHESRERRNNTLLDLLFTLLGLTSSVASTLLAPDGDFSAEFKKLGLLTVGVSFAAVLFQALFAIYLRRRRSPGSRLKRYIQDTYAAALANSPLNPRRRSEP
jgi:hypothetical protein